VRRKAAVLGVCAAALATGLVAGLLIPAASQGADTRTLTWCEKNKGGFTRHIDVGKPGGSSGDFEIVTRAMYNPQTGEKIGTDVNRFTFVRALGRRNGIGLVEATALLAKGKITAYSAFKFSSFRNGANFAITGGSGRYRNITGSGTAQPGKCRGARGERITLRFTL
jgi:hypothetical protein